jgi:hypothetical protein
METEVVNFANGWQVEHEDSFTSYVYKNGAVMKAFKGKETSWQDAERYAMDMVTKELYGWKGL